MSEPICIAPTAVYDSEQTCSALQIGESKLRELVKDGRLYPLDFTARWRFFGQRLIELCLRASEAQP